MRRQTETARAIKAYHEACHDTRAIWVSTWEPRYRAATTLLEFKDVSAMLAGELAGMDTDLPPDFEIGISFALTDLRRKLENMQATP